MPLSDKQKKQKLKDLDKFAALALRLNAPISGCLKKWVAKQSKALTK